MKLVHDSGLKGVDLMEEDGAQMECAEQLRVFQWGDDDEEADDFELLSHNEKVAFLGLEKEAATPNGNKGKVTRHTIDGDSMTNFVIVVSNTTSWW